MRDAQRTNHLARAALACGSALCLVVSTAAAQPQTFRQYQLEPNADRSRYELVLRTVEMPAVGPEEVLVRVHAAALNGGLDIEMLEAIGPGIPDFTGRVPVSDAAGEIVAIGDGVERFAVGDRVVTTYVPDWIDGDLLDDYFSSIRGIEADGVLSEYIVVDQSALVAPPAYLSFEEAATLPVAGLTAWVSLFKYGGLEADEFVLLEGTGGVSTFGLVFSVAAGARPIITSSSDRKLERATALGAFGTVNYLTYPEWHERVRALTGGTGVDHVLEVGGRDTLEKALQSLAYNGHAALIGMLTGFYSEIPAAPVLGANARLTAIFVGSRADFEDMNEFLAEHEPRPVIDRVFEFEDAPAAFEHMASGDYMGKIVIRVR
ncbi:MAG: NAD(P)-dependent alcohol dehydrogenase [Gammaproteobacteria bacterium]|nr:NAD(P)-dependent alcohol dehydrogenase [Gammaproteobacteria bacterium]